MAWALPHLLSWSGAVGASFAVLACNFLGAVSVRPSLDSALAPAVGNGAVTVEVLFVRHGHACHNLMKYQGRRTWRRNGPLHHCRYRDPPLTDCGLENSKQNGQELRSSAGLSNWNPDLVASSSMLRAMETALAMFPGKKVHPLPFISETGGGDWAPCNEPESVSNQQKALNSKKPLPTFQPSDVDWKYVTDAGFNDQNSNKWTVQDAELVERAGRMFGVRGGGHRREWKVDDARSAVLYKEFRAFLGEKVVPELLANLKKTEGSDRKTIRIAIVSHSQFLKSRLMKYFKGTDCEAIYLVNNAAKLGKYIFDKTTYKLTEEANKCLQDPLGTVTLNGVNSAELPKCLWGKESKSACPEDFARCDQTKTLRFVNVKTPNVNHKDKRFKADAKCCVTTACQPMTTPADDQLRKAHAKKLFVKTEGSSTDEFAFTSEEVAASFASGIEEGLDVDEENSKEADMDFGEELTGELMREAIPATSSFIVADAEKDVAESVREQGVSRPSVS